ncbi:hypothetical protein [Stenotrophomonas phage RAS14]
MTLRHIPNELINSVRSLYAAPNRFYHSLNHLDHLMAVKNQVLTEFMNDEELWEDIPLRTVDEYLSLAILFHDADYNIWAGSPTNENNSVKVLWDHYTTFHQNGWTHFDLTIVAQMIWTTANHHKDNSETSFLEQLMLDIDISNFAESLDVCKYNQNQIFLEFEPRFPNKDQFLAGNVSFLKNLLDRPSVYYTRLFADKEAKARANIEAMIKGGN